MKRNARMALAAWGGADGIVPARITPRDPRRFAFREVEGAEPELRLLTRAAPVEGAALPERKFIIHRHGGRYGNPWGLGLGQRLFWPVFFKRQGIGFWLTAIEKFATPTPVGKYPPDTSDAAKEQLLAALGALARDAAVVIPDGMAVELVEAKRAGTFETYPAMARYMDEDIATTVLGETLTTSAGEAGSRALGEVHNAVRLELVKADADALSDTLNATLVRWLVELNLPGAPPPRLWWSFQAPDDLNTLAERDARLAAIGYRPSAARIEEVYGAGYEALAAPGPAAPSGAAPGGGQGLAALFAERGRPARPARPRDAADDLAAQLNDLVAFAQDAMVDRLRDLVMTADSLQALADGLVALFPALDDAELARLMGDALTVAALAGRSDLADGLA